MGSSRRHVTRVISIDVGSHSHRVPSWLRPSNGYLLVRILVEIIPFLPVDLVKDDIVDKFKRTIKNGSAFIFIYAEDQVLTYCIYCDKVNVARFREVMSPAANLCTDVSPTELD